MDSASKVSFDIATIVLSSTWLEEGSAGHFSIAEVTRTWTRGVNWGRKQGRELNCVRDSRRYMPSFGCRRTSPGDCK